MAGGLTSAAPEETTGGISELHLRSVGRLLVPGVRYRQGHAEHFDERCSATLVSNRRDEARSDLILSAWHCIEHYRDLSRRLVYESSQGIRKEARILASGEGMHADWLLLRLAEPMIHPTYIGLGPSTSKDQSKIGAPRRNAALQPLMMAGYPRAAGTDLRVLETAVGCMGTGRDGLDISSNCVLQKGASGGAVFAFGGAYAFLGVVSRGDGESQSIYVPLERFRRQIRPFFKHTVKPDLP